MTSESLMKSAQTISLIVGILGSIASLVPLLKNKKDHGPTLFWICSFVVSIIIFGGSFLIPVKTDNITGDQNKPRKVGEIAPAPPEVQKQPEKKETDMTVAVGAPFNRSAKINEPITMAAQKYMKGYSDMFVNWNENVWSFNLGQKYSKIKGVLGIHYSNLPNNQVLVKFYNDNNQIIKSYELRSDQLPIKIELPVKDVSNLRLVAITQTGFGCVNLALCDAEVEY